MHSWVILGAGNLFGDIQDAIHQRGDSIYCVVANQSLPKSLNTKILNYCNILSIQEFASRAFNKDAFSFIFGFLDPKKESFLKSVESLVGERGNFGNLVHPKAYLALTTKIGVGNYFGPMSVVAPNVVIGDFNYVNRCASIGHDTKIGNFNHFGPNATICGNCLIGDNNYFGASSTLLDEKIIHNSITIGAAALVRENLSESGTYVGVPAKLLVK